MSNSDDITFDTSAMFCADCGNPAYSLLLNGYGQGKHVPYCFACYHASNAPGVDSPVHTHVYGESAEVTTLLDGDTCDNCGVCVITSIKHGPDFIKADAEWQARR